MDRMAGPLHVDAPWRLPSCTREGELTDDLQLTVSSSPAAHDHGTAFRIEFGQPVPLRDSGTGDDHQV
jgi:hypothetical protein